MPSLALPGHGRGAEPKGRIPARVEASDFPGETFRVLKEEIKHYGEYRTRRLVLEAWERVGQDG